MFSFQKVAKITLVLVYLVIIAGGVVRMTGSGMGCPDWPKCFGYYVPPTDVEQLLWKPHHSYAKGQIIIVDEKLMVATSEFVSGAVYSSANWKPYTKHNYAKFNPMHTWVEYINRLFGALSGFATLFLAFLSFQFVRTRPLLTVLSVLLLFCMGFQAWLGAAVVYSVLNPIRITLHMLMALFIVGLLIYLIYKTKDSNNALFLGKKNKCIALVALLLTLLQILLGTQVRQWVDSNQIVNQGFAVSSIPVSFYIHRTLSVLLLMVNLYLWRSLANEGYRSWLFRSVIILLLLIVFSGVAMYYFDFPFGMQSIHLVTASIIFGLQYYLVLQLKN